MSTRVVSAQNVSRMCLVCGVENGFGLGARFLELEDGRLMGIFEPREQHQSYPGRLHGGVSSAILDETIGRAVNLSDAEAWGVTIELTVKYRKPVPLDRPIRAIATITKDSGRVFEGAGTIVLDDGSVAVEATGRYLKLPIARIADGDFDAEWFEDARELPDSVDM